MDLREIDELGGPLRREPAPVQLVRFAVSPDDPCALRLFYPRPEGAVSEVEVDERADRVTVTLTQRRLAGVGPDGAVHAWTAAWVPDGMLVGLQRPLGDRPVYDGSAARRVLRLLDDAGEGSMDRAFITFARRDGCPLWLS
jgi:hypothetical protein